MENMTPLSLLRLSMCKFSLMDGRQIDENDCVGGWRDFAFKKYVNGISLAGRFISPADYGCCLHELAGFAVHWVGQIQLVGGKAKDVLREIMLVHKTGKVKIFSLNLLTQEWDDYLDDITNPAMPHLVNYNLEIHGITL